MHTSDHHPRIIRGWLEQDLYTRWRRVYPWQPGLKASIKRTTHKRERREARQLIAEQLAGDVLASEFFDDMY